MTAFRRIAAAAPALFLSGLLPSSAAVWSTLALPPLAQPYAAPSMAHLPDGRFLFGSQGSIHLQQTWGAAATAVFSSVPAGVDPSFIAVRSDTAGLIGAGGWGASGFYTFAPSDSASAFTPVLGVTTQNYAGAWRDAAGFYSAGADTGSGGTHHGIRYIAFDGSVNRVLIEDISVYSCGFARDAAGDLYVGDNDDGKVYRFTAAQLDAVIAGGAALTVADGVFVHDFGGGGNLTTLACDGLGRLWAAGWLENGINVFDPVSGIHTHLTPDLDNANYAVTAFERGGAAYVGWINQSDPFSAGTSQTYGYAPAAQAIPEPAAAGLALLGAAVAVLRRRFRGGDRP